MYFVVFITKIKQNKVVPHSWIRGKDGDLNSYIEHFINFGVNRNHQFETFWTHDPFAFDRDDIPRASYPVNHTARNTNTFPYEGWYMYRIKKFKRL